MAKEYSIKQVRFILDYSTKISAVEKESSKYSKMKVKNWLYLRIKVCSRITNRMDWELMCKKCRRSR